MTELCSTISAVEINYLCVHKKLRSKRLAPVLIKEVTRQCHLKGIFQAIYTAGVVLPTPVSTCRYAFFSQLFTIFDMVASYYHRSLNIPKLVDVRFTYVPRSMTLARMVRQNKLPEKTTLKGLREIEEKDVPEVDAMFKKYMARYDMAPLWKIDEVRHQFLSGRGEGERDTKSLGGRRKGQVIWTYVVEVSSSDMHSLYLFTHDVLQHPESGKITDFFSFYSLPSTIIGNTKHGILEAAYLFYYATDVAFQEKADEAALKKRLEALVGDALILADQAKFDVFNALTLMDNVSFLQDLKVRLILPIITVV